MKIYTVCEHEMWAGEFGIDADGNQPECTEVITLEVEEDCLEREGDILRPSFSVECPKCGATLDWPQEWEIEE